MFANLDFSRAADQAAPQTKVPKKEGATHSVGMKNWIFSPKELTIHVGDRVVFRNDDDSNHTVQFEDSALNSSGIIKIGKEFSVTFDKPGVYPYHCKPHHDYNMTGTITVLVK